eukprot:gene19677-26362_t
MELTSHGEGSFQNLDISGLAKVVGPLTIGTNVSQIAEQETLIILGTASVKCDLNVRGDLNVVGKISATSQHDKLKIDRLQVVKDAVFDGLVKSQSDFDFDIPQGQHNVFRVGGRVVATLGAEGMRLYDPDTNMDIESVLCAIKAKEYEKFQALHDTMRAITQCLGKKNLDAVRMHVIDLAVMLLDIRT